MCGGRRGQSKADGQVAESRRPWGGEGQTGRETGHQQQRRQVAGTGAAAREASAAAFACLLPEPRESQNQREAGLEAPMFVTGNS